jgi:ferric-dicitrate binding protein FerR (iron transport regulator)
MCAKTVPLDRDVLAELRRGDEHALERLVRDRFASLNEVAKTELQDEAYAAPRVVENVFLRVWAERSHFETPEALDEFLHTAVHQGAVRERSRRAGLHRLEAHEGVKNVARPGMQTTADADEAWAHVENALHATDGRHTPELDRMMADLTRHETAVHVAEMGKRPSLVMPITLGVLALALVGAGIWALDRAGTEKAVARSLAAPDARVVESRPGQMGVVTLDDGSTVRVGSSSRFRIAPKVAKDVAAFGLEGTAAFQVVPGLPRRFEVRARNASIIATGTAFAIRAFTNEPEVIVRVTEGSVTVSSPNASRTVEANHTVAVDSSGAIREPPAKEASEALSWVDGRFVFTGHTLREALPELVRWFGTTVEVRDSTLLDRPVSIDSPLDSPGQAIGAIEKSANVKMTFEGKKMIFQDAAAAKATASKKARR